MLRTYSLYCLAVALAALTSACAHEEQISAVDAARASCEERGVAAGDAMDACIAETAATIRAAREHSTVLPPPPPPRRPPLSPPNTPR